MIKKKFTIHNFQLSQNHLVFKIPINDLDLAKALSDIMYQYDLDNEDNDKNLKT